MPFPNEHSARLKNPKDFKPGTFSRTKGGVLFPNVKIPSTASLVRGQLPKQTGKQSFPQSIRFPVKDFTEAQARKFLKDNNVKFILFEPAINKVAKKDGSKNLILNWKKARHQFTESTNLKIQEDLDLLLSFGKSAILVGKLLGIKFVKTDKFIKAIAKNKDKDKKNPMNKISGSTTEDENHKHKFEIDMEGNGKTLNVDGHEHTIENFSILPSNLEGKEKHEHDLILGNASAKRNKRGIIKCYMQVVNKSDNGYEFAYALDSMRPRTLDNFAIGAVIKSDIQLEDGETAFIKCDSVEASDIAGKLGVKLLNPIIANTGNDISKRKPDTTKEILERAIQEDVLTAEESIIKRLQDIKWIKQNELIEKKDQGNIRKEFPLIKIDEKQLVYGVVYEPLKVDSQKDYATSLEIEKAAHKFLEQFNSISLMHQKKIDARAKVVESFIAPTTFKMGGQTIIKGSWVLVTHIIDKNLWKLVKSGKLDAYSIEGTGLAGVPIPELEGR